MQLTSHQASGLKNEPRNKIWSKDLPRGSNTCRVFSSQWQKAVTADDQLCWYEAETKGLEALKREKLPPREAGRQAANQTTQLSDVPLPAAGEILQRFSFSFYFDPIYSFFFYRAEAERVDCS
jgi:hypothetical protein